MEVVVVLRRKKHGHNGCRKSVEQAQREEEVITTTGMFGCHFDTRTASFMVEWGETAVADEWFFTTMSPHSRHLLRKSNLTTLPSLCPASICSRSFSHKSPH